MAQTSRPLQRRRRSDGELTRRRVIDAAVDSILEVGYYQTSSNEIARRAGVTWGTLQHQFGSRERLLLEVLHDWWDQLEGDVARAEAVGDTLEERLTSVLGVLIEHYGRPPNLAQLQILLDLTRNPNTSDESRKIVYEHGQNLSRAWQPLFARALGDAAKEEDLVRFAFTAMRGYLVGELVASRITTRSDDAFQRELLVRGIAESIRTEAHARGIELD